MSQHFNTDDRYASWGRNRFFSTGRRTRRFSRVHLLMKLESVFGTDPGEIVIPTIRHPLDAEVDQLVQDCRKANGTRWQQFAFDLDDPAVLRAERLGLIQVEREFTLIRATKETA